MIKLFSKNNHGEKNNKKAPINIGAFLYILYESFN